ncbi:MAG: hypothetical protein ABFS86_20035 [Planctomycetota bacterium]
MAFFLFPSSVISGDAADVVERVALRQVYPSNALTCWLMNAVADVTGLDAVSAIRLVAGLAGLVYAWAAVGIARECFEDAGRRAGVTALLLTGGAAALFFGTIEVYAPVAAGIAVYIRAALRSLSGRGPSWAPPLALGVAFTLHGAAGLLLPSLVLLANGGRPWPLRPVALARAAVLFLLPVAAVFGWMYLVTWGGELPAAGHERYGTFLGGMKQGPLLPLALSFANLTHRYALMDAHHIVGIVNLLLIAAPAGLALLFAGTRERSPARSFLLSAAVFLVAFPVFWNVNFPLRRDWDLFSPMGIPLTLLGALAYLRTVERPGAAAVRVAALSLFCFVPFVLTATGTRYERNLTARKHAKSLERAAAKTSGDAADRLLADSARWRERAATLDPDGTIPMHHRATAWFLEGRREEAAREYRRAHELSPEDSWIAGDLGVTLYALGRHDEGTALVEEAIRLRPTRLKPRIDRARIHIAEGDGVEAMRVLERGVRAGITDQKWVDEALRLLRRLKRKHGEREHAEILTGFLEARGSE